MGRWQKVHSYPDIICDTGHNVDGIEYIHVQLNAIHKTFDQEIHIVFGMVNDKDIRGFCEHCRNMPPIILPKQALNAPSGK